MDTRPIGVFDSGLGGLTAVRQLQKLLPDETIIYFGDTGRMPYGSRPAQQIRTIAQQNIDFFADMQPKAMIAACGTISSTSNDVLLSSATKVVGVLYPGAETAAKLTGDKIGVIATATSIASGAYEKAIKEFAPDKKVYSVACPDFVSIIEAGHYDKNDPVVIEAVDKYLCLLKKEGINTILLGCTHYGLIGEAIMDYFDGDIQIVEASSESALALKKYLDNENMLSGKKTGEDKFYTSGSVSDFEKLGHLFLGKELIGKVEYVSPMPI